MAFDTIQCALRKPANRVPGTPVFVSAGKTSNDFKYLNTHAPAEDMDFTGLAEVQDAIRELGIQLEEEKDVFKALGGLLHLGQVGTFHIYGSRRCFGLRTVVRVLRFILSG